MAVAKRGKVVKRPAAPKAAVETVVKKEPIPKKDALVVEDKIVVTKVDKGKVAVQSVRDVLHHPFCNQFISRDFPTVVDDDNWTKCQIEAGLLKEVK